MPIQTRTLTFCTVALGWFPRTGGHDRMVVRNQRFTKLKREARMLLGI